MYVEGTLCVWMMSDETVVSEMVDSVMSLAVSWASWISAV